MKNKEKLAIQLNEQLKSSLINSSLPPEEILALMMKLCLSLMQVTQSNLVEMKTSDGRKLSLKLDTPSVHLLLEAARNVEYYLFRIDGR
ncbi:hypothetical protein [Pectobacterium versatile]|uniref:hypothetical protein n=1 Tax=Pectobacterium versatile TaxID=2488639 RepID=UPI001F362F43|nr:hypothetical protein [Pectobacterium versatile]